jgi:gamma-glutamyl-gamma-aminobutyrate hydrolase PuuD
VKPRIGISAYPRTVDTVHGPTLLHTTSRFYVDSVVRAGGVPLVLPVIDELDDLAVLLGGVDGVVLTGGGDVAPARYGHEPHPETHNVDPARDDFDLALLRACLDADVPLLATCRGMQVVNVGMGGSLVQHVPEVAGEDHSFTTAWASGRHDVEVAPDSLLAAALGMTRLSVNSLHHQAVLDAAPGLRPVAWAPDGTVEAVEQEGNGRLVAVQWHPELMQESPEQQGLFRQLVGEAAEVAARR